MEKVEFFDFGNNTEVKVNENKIKNLMKQIAEEFVNKGYIVNFHIDVLDVKDLKLNIPLKN